MLQHCVANGLKCVETKVEPAASACRTGAATKCAGALDGWRTKTLPKILTGIGAKCGPDKLSASDILAAGGLGFEDLQALCVAFGSDLDTFAGLTDCLGRALSCRSEIAVAASMPRASDFLADAGALNGLCMPAPSGDLGGLPNPKPDGALAVACQNAIGKAALATLTRTLATTQGCVAMVRKCELSGTAPAECIGSLAPKCATLFDKLTIVDKGTFDKGRAVIAKACATLPPASLLTTPGLGFTFDAARCAALGVANVATADDVTTCVMAEQRCAAADVLGLGAPQSAAVLTAVGQRASGGDGLACPAFTGPTSP